MTAPRLAALVGVGMAVGAGAAHAEAMFLSRQYTRCDACHYSPTGGGLLTPYGRSLSREELSTTGRSASPTPGKGGEEAFLWGLLGDTQGPVNVGIDLRPAHLNASSDLGSFERDFFMTADLLAAYRSHGVTVYGEIGRQAQGAPKIDSYEHWVSFESQGGLGLRLGRFLPAYGIRLADHTAFTRGDLGFDAYDQVYAVELSHAGQHHLAQVALGPGRADSIRAGRRAFAGTGRLQLDLSPRGALVVSGLLRAPSGIEPRDSAAGVAFGFSPSSRVSVWTEADARLSGSPAALTLLNETSLEVVRGVWLKLSPQLRYKGHTHAGLVRMAFELDLLPRTHWNVGVSYYRDWDRANDVAIGIFLAQLHLYL